jgi:hypothetical protein
MSTLLLLELKRLSADGIDKNTKMILKKVNTIAHGHGDSKGKISCKNPATIYKEGALMYS